MLDLIFFAIVAVVLVIRLLKILGRDEGGFRPKNHGVDDFIHQTFKKREEQENREQDNDDNVIPLSADYSQLEDEAEVPPDFSVYGKAEKGLHAIAEADETFDIDEFLQGAELAFEYILDSYVRGDKKTLKTLLTPEIYADFEQAIDERLAQKQQIEEVLIGIDKVDVVAASLENKTIAAITLIFKSKQVDALYNANGEVIDGDPHKVIDKVDVWTFERDLKSQDPNWMLVATATDE